LPIKEILRRLPRNELIAELQDLGYGVCPHQLSKSMKSKQVWNIKKKSKEVLELIAEFQDLGYGVSPQKPSKSVTSK
jgi:hypothetical protein